MSEYLPRVVYQMCVHGAYIVGSVALKMNGHDVETNDYDLIVPPSMWSVVALLVPQGATVNKFGGIRFTTVDHDGKEVEVDVWPDYIENYLSKCKSKHNLPVCVVDFINGIVFEAKRIV